METKFTRSVYGHSNICNIYETLWFKCHNYINCMSETVEADEMWDAGETEEINFIYLADA